MMKPKSPSPKANSDGPTSLPTLAQLPEVLEGLLVRGKVLRRWRKVLDTGTEVVYYDISGVTVQVYRPEGVYLSIGEAVELQVNVSCYQAKGGVRYSLVQKTDKQEGEF